MTHFKRRGNALLWCRKTESLELQPWGQDTIRVRATVNRDFADVPGALVAKAGTSGEIEIGEQGALLRSGRLEARVTEYGRIRFLRIEKGIRTAQTTAGQETGKKNSSTETLLEEVDWRPEYPALYPPGRYFESLLRSKQAYL